jgi:hypothetical protein
MCPGWHHLLVLLGVFVSLIGVEVLDAATDPGGRRALARRLNTVLGGRLRLLLRLYGLDRFSETSPYAQLSGLLISALILIITVYRLVR